MSRIILLSVLLFIASASFALNSPPVISNMEVSINEVGNEITVTFDLADTETNNAEISVKLSDNGGETFLAEVLNAQGDVGFPVAPGSGRQIIFNYNASAHPDAGWLVKLIADDEQTVDIQEIVDQIDSVHLRDDLTFIASGIRNYKTGTAHLEEVKDFIESRFSQHGLYTYREPFVVDNYNAHNIIGRFAGAKDEAVTYIIDGHFDTVDDSPGADDNGSAVAGVLEALRVLSQYQFEHTIKFIGFDFEESTPVLGLYGSREYVTNGIKSYEQLEGVFNFEMIGYYTEEPNTQQIPSGFNLLFPDQYNMVVADSFRGDFVVNTANTPSNDLKTAFDNAAATYVPALRVISVSLGTNGIFSPDFRRSDHASFWDGGYKALLLTDGANFRNLNYHTANDTIGALNFTFMSNIVKATVGALATLAKPLHATSATKSVFSTAIEPSMENCDWRFIQSESAIYFFTDKNCAVKNWNISLFDALGKLVVNQTSTDGSVTFQTTTLAPGLYFLTAANVATRVSKRVTLK